MPLQVEVVPLAMNNSSWFVFAAYGASRNARGAWPQFCPINLEAQSQLESAWKLDWSPPEVSSKISHSYVETNVEVVLEHMLDLM